MVRRHELSDEEWDVLSGLLPRTGTGRPRRDDRVVLNGIVWKLRTGSASGESKTDARDAAIISSPRRRFLVLVTSPAGASA
ncbi:transposase [Streptomyces sp. NPDC005571]|uniref:transposase n=1 Tax=Streptomyces sp. NPDC005571 TaxID=3156888 RepID=UPI0033B405A3